MIIFNSGTLFSAAIMGVVFLSGCTRCRIPDQNIACQGSHCGHLQGVATDYKSIYWQFTEELVKTDMEGKMIKSISVPSHHGDLTYFKRKIYVAVNLGEFNQPAGKADSWIYVYHSDNLDFIEKYSIPQVVHGAGGIAYHDGRFAVVSGLPKGYDENYVYLYDTRLNFIERKTLKSGYTKLGIQTADYFNNYWWFGCYGAPDNAGLLRTDKEFQSLTQYKISPALGVIALSEDKFLIGKSEKDQTGKYNAQLVATSIE